MARRSDSAKVEVWRQRFAKFSAAGATVAVFCAGEGVSVPSFFEWRRKLRRLDAAASTAADGDTLRGASGSESTGTSFTSVAEFAEVRLVAGRRGPGASSSRPSASTIVATTPGGVRIEIPGDDERLVAVALRALVSGVR